MRLFGDHRTLDCPLVAAGVARERWLGDFANLNFLEYRQVPLILVELGHLP